MIRPASRTRPLALALLLLAAACEPSGRSSASMLAVEQERAVQVPAPVVSPSPRPRSRFLTATGSLRSYDLARRVLVIRSAGREQSFVVAPEARLWIGSRRAPIEQLATDIGEQATVAYAEKDGVRTTHTVRLRRRHGERAEPR